MAYAGSKLQGRGVQLSNGDSFNRPAYVASGLAIDQVAS